MSVPCSMEGREEGGKGRREGHFAEEAAGKEASDSGSYSECPGLAKLELCPKASNSVAWISRCFWLEVSIKL